MQPAGLQSPPVAGTLIFEELYKITLCNLAWGKFYWRDFLLCALARLLAVALVFSGGMCGNSHVP